jgi:hypothetical protein
VRGNALVSQRNPGIYRPLSPETSSRWHENRSRWFSWIFIGMKAARLTWIAANIKIVRERQDQVHCIIPQIGTKRPFPAGSPVQRLPTGNLNVAPANICHLGDRTMKTFLLDADHNPTLASYIDVTGTLLSTDLLPVAATCRD